MAENTLLFCVIVNVVTTSLLQFQNVRATNWPTYYEIQLSPNKHLKKKASSQKTTKDYNSDIRLQKDNISGIKGPLLKRRSDKILEKRGLEQFKAKSERLAKFVRLCTEVAFVLLCSLLIF